MNKAELIEVVAARIDSSKKDAGEAVQAVVDAITEAVARGQKVSISGFGVFEKAARPARTYRKPSTGEAISKVATAVPKFRPGGDFRALVSGEKSLGDAVRAASDAVDEAVRRVTGRKPAASAAPAKKAPAKKATTTARKTAASAAPAASATATKTATSAKRTSAAKKTAAAAAAAPAATKAPAKRASTAKRSASSAAAAKKTASSASAAKKTASSGAAAKKTTTRARKAPAKTAATAPAPAVETPSGAESAESAE